MPLPPAPRENRGHGPALSIQSVRIYASPSTTPAYLFPRRFSSLRSVMTCRAPVQPNGCPKATAPPRGFTFSGGSPSFSTQ